VNGKFEVLSVHISEEAMKLNDREMLEDLIAAAANQAIAKVRQQLSEESAKMAASIGLPPGMLGGGLPGMG
jgi:DNA-binding protein YbaB